MKLSSGFKGEVGAQGNQGVKGDMGPQGYNGIPGLKGESGPVGPQGRIRCFVYCKILLLGVHLISCFSLEGQSFNFRSQRNIYSI